MERRLLPAHLPLRGICGRAIEAPHAGVGKRDQRFPLRIRPDCGGNREIKRAGYDVFLVLEATIGFNRRDENAEDEDENQPEVAEEPKRTFEATGKIKFTSPGSPVSACAQNCR